MLKLEFFQNTVQDYLLFLMILLAGIVALRIFKAIILKRIKVFTQKTAIEIDEFLVGLFEKMALPLLYFGIFYLASRYLVLTEGINKVINLCAIILLTIQGIRFAIALVGYGMEKYWARKEGLTEANKRNLNTLLKILKVVIWGLGLVFLLDNLGFKISAVIAGLGIGGVAVALAAQAVLGDLFSYFAIFFDKPFEIGDFIIVDDFLGVVEHIGIKTTRLRSLGGEQVVFSNSDLTDHRIRNYKRMEKRRVVFKLGVTYQTTLGQLKEIPLIITKIIKNIEDTVFDRAHFFSFGDFSLIFEVVYYVLSSDYNKYMDTQQKINFAIKEEFEKRKIEFAYPTQTVYLSKIS